VFSAFLNALKIPELRSRIFYTLALLVIARVGAHIPLPGVDPEGLQRFLKEHSGDGGNNLLNLYSMFTGGALTQGAICALGIMPYISAQIIFQLMTAALPSLSRLAQEGDVGRQKLSQYTRYATVAICVVQGAMLILALENPARLPGFSQYDIAIYGPIVLGGGFWFLLSSVIILTAGTLLLMWLGEQITQRGIGNGVSLLITVGILSRIPSAAHDAYMYFFDSTIGAGKNHLGWPAAIIMLAFFIAVTVGVILVVQGQRKIPVQYAKRVVGNKVMGGQSSFLPLKVNYSGVMPVIFASSLLMVPSSLFTWIGTAFKPLSFLADFGQRIYPGSLMYEVLQALMILFFSYFWVAVMFKPIQIADDLKKHGGYVPGVRPGEPTAKFLDFVMTRLTLAGAIFLTVIAILPNVVFSSLGINYNVAQFFGGTSMLITVGVILDTMKQVETFLLQRHYDGFLQKGRIRSRADSRQGMTGDALGNEALLKIVVPVAILLAIGLLAAVIQALRR
jgi:preprotein translocase subunit SecY